MAAVAGTGTTFNLPNFVGELFNVTPTETPLLSMIGGLTGGEASVTKEDVWQTTDNNAAAQTAAIEGADPDYENRDRSEVSNVKQIYQYGFSVTYTKQAATGNLGTSATSILGTNPVQDELAHQQNLKLQRMARDTEYSFLRGTYANPTTNASARKTRGMLAAVTSNEEAASAADLAKSHVDGIMLKMANSGALFNNVVAFCGGFQKQQFSNIYGYAPESRNVGGVNIQQVETDFGPVGVVFDRYMPDDDILFIDVSLLTPTHLVIPGKGMVFVEPLAHTGSSWNFQLYGEIGLKYGPEQFHGKITNLSTS